MCLVNWIIYYFFVCDLFKVRLVLGFFFRAFDRNRDVSFRFFVVGLFLIGCSVVYRVVEWGNG